MRLFVLALALVLALATAACGDDEGTRTAGSPAPNGTPAPTKASGELILGSTTSVQDSGLLDVLVPRFEQITGYNVKVIAAGSGAAIESGRRGDVDVLFVHSPAAEKKLVADGFGVERALVMHNDFVIVGPESDPAGLKSLEGITNVMTALAKGAAPFISRGDDSGTHALERKLWSAAGITPSGSWYEESGQGMGATLQIGSQRNGYVLTDRATYLAQRDNLDLTILHQGSPELLNLYSVIVINPEKHADTNVAGARAWAAFLLGDEAQRIIGAFGVDKVGEQLFIPDAGKPEPGS